MSKYQNKKVQQRGIKSFADIAPNHHVSNLADWPDMHQWMEDGEDHICIERKARTELGRYLCMDNGDFPFTSRYFGRFNSLEGFWLYVTCPDFGRREHLRTVSGVALQNIRRDAMTVMVKINNLRAIMMQAMYDRIVQNESLRALFIENKLPFDMYRVDEETGRRMRAPHMMHMVYVGYHNLLECLKEGGDVDSAIFHARNEKDGDMYRDLLPAYQIAWLNNREKQLKEKEERARLDALAEQQAQKEREEAAFALAAEVVPEAELVEAIPPVYEDIVSTPTLFEPQQHIEAVPMFVKPSELETEAVQQMVAVVNVVINEQ